MYSSCLTTMPAVEPVFFSSVCLSLWPWVGSLVSSTQATKTDLKMKNSISQMC